MYKILNDVYSHDKTQKTFYEISHIFPPLLPPPPPSPTYTQTYTHTYTPHHPQTDLYVYIKGRRRRKGKLIHT